MKRRQAIKRATLMATAMALGRMTLLKAQDGPGGELRVPLDQWAYIVFERHGKRIRVPVDEVFRALQEAV